MGFLVAHKGCRNTRHQLAALAMSEDGRCKIVYRASKAATRAPAFDSATKLPGYGGFVPGATGVIERNYYETSGQCFTQQQQPKQSHVGREREFRPMGSMRAATAPHVEPPRFLPGYQGYVPQVRFTFECSEGTLAKTWGSKSPINGIHGGGSFTPCKYNPQKERFKPRMDKYTTGYTGHLPKATAQIEQSYARIARGVETNEFDKPVAQGNTEFQRMQAAYKPKEAAERLPDYKLPGYTGFIPQTNFTFEKRYSESVLDAARESQRLATQH